MYILCIVFGQFFWEGCGSLEESSSAQNIYDIGGIIVEKSKDITDHEKYVIFENYFWPGKKYELKKH